MARRKRSERPVRAFGKQLCIFCEGANTEPCYIERYRTLKGYGKEVNVVKVNKNTPLQLVDEAISEKKRRKKEISEDNLDEFWVVFDREDIGNRTKKLMCQTFEKAKANNINIVISNVCFEVWLLLHLENNRPPPYYSQSELIQNSNLIEKLENLGLPRDTKNKSNVEQIMRVLVTEELIEQAKKLAKTMNEDSKNCHDNDCQIHELNPYTNFYILLDAIDQFIKK